MSGVSGSEGMAKAARALVGVVLAAGLLAGCSAVGSSTIDTYDLSAPTVATRSKGRALQVLVPEPVVDRAYDTERLLVRASPTEIAYFSGAQWADRLPRLVQSRLVQTLERSGRFRAVGRPGQGLAIDRQLVVEIRAFDYRPNEGRVVVVLGVKTMDDRSGRVISTVEHASEEPVAGGGAHAVTAAFDAALTRVLTAIVTGVDG